MIGSILGWIASGGLSGIARELRGAHKDRLDAANDESRIAADVRIRELEARRDSILASQRDRFERWVRIGFALPFMVYLWKLIIFDKVFGWGATDPLSPMLTEIFWIVLGGFFFISAAKVIRK